VTRRESTAPATQNPFSLLLNMAYELENTESAIVWSNAVIKSSENSAKSSQNNENNGLLGGDHIGRKP
jgi:hypothetical protein